MAALPAQWQRRLQQLDQELEVGILTELGWNLKREEVLKEYEKTNLSAPSLLIAVVTETADVALSQYAGGDDEVLSRIKKCLLLARHPGTPLAEVEAAQARANARMEALNITMAEVLAHQTPEERRRSGGKVLS